LGEGEVKSDERMMAKARRRLEQENKETAVIKKRRLV